jgi:hypothetical protein
LAPFIIKFIRPLASGEKNPSPTCPGDNTIYIRRSTRTPHPKHHNNNTRKNSNNLQRDLRLESEVNEKAKQLRILNFYKSKNSKLNATSTYSAKDRQPSETKKYGTTDRASPILRKLLKPCKNGMRARQVAIGNK